VQSHKKHSQSDRMCLTGLEHLPDEQILITVKHLFSQRSVVLNSNHQDMFPQNKHFT